MDKSKSSEGKEVRYKCRHCGDWFKRIPFGYKGYHALCNKCFDLLIKINHL